MRALAEAGTVVATGVLVATHALSTTVLIVELAGALAVRPLVMIGGALWEGARAEVVRFGGDAAATFLQGLRRRLHISPRHIQSSPHTGRFPPEL